jgi:Flp pilus assembly pilin Flp
VAHSARGMTTAEYGLVLAAVALVMYGTYLLLGSSVSSLANGVDSVLTLASHGVPVAQSTPKP